MRAGRALGRALLVLAAGGALFAGWLLFVWPPPSWWRTHWPAETAFMRLRGQQYAEAGGAPPRLYRPVPLDSMSVWLGRAATVGEDDAFFEHGGIDYRALREALGYRRATFDWGAARDRAELWRALKGAYAHRERLRGASTITQQLAKNLYLSPSRNPLRKVKEAVVAWRLEWALPKERILALYLNVAELGPNTWGVEAASRRYYGRSAVRVSLDQAALLMATLPHPLSSNPAYRPGRARWRQQLILRRLRGENVAVPREASDDAGPPTGDTLRAPAETPAESLVRSDSVLAPAAPDSTPPRQGTTSPAPAQPDSPAGRTTTPRP